MTRKQYATLAQKAAKAARSMLFRTPEYKTRGREAALLLRWYRAALTLQLETA